VVIIGDLVDEIAYAPQGLTELVAVHMRMIALEVALVALDSLDLIGNRLLLLHFIGSLKRIQGLLKLQQLYLRHPTPPQYFGELWR
jgi:hypothetical protein